MTDPRQEQAASPSSPEPESARQTADLAALKRMLQVARGCFSLSFAVCNDRALRDDLIQSIKIDFPGLVVTVLPSEAVDVYQLVLEKLAGITPEAIFILDLEASIPSQAQTFPSLRTLNSSREAWEKLNCPVVFWLAEYAAAKLATHAPDFWRYRSHQFEFVAEMPHDGQTIDGPFPGYEMVDGLSLEEKRFRMAELEQRLSEAGEPPPPGLLPHVLDWLYELAYLHRQGNHFEQSEVLLRQALTLAESEFGPDAPQCATPLINLAALLIITNRLVEAELLARRALAITERSFGADDPMVAFSLNTLAELLTDTNRFAEAEPLYRRALAIAEKKFDTNHHHRATGLNNLAKLLQDTDRAAEAEPLLRQALTILEKSLGAEHPDLAACLNNLAALLKGTNRLAEAEPLYRRALALVGKSLGENHPSVAICLNNLAGLLRATNRLAEAEALYRRALAIVEKSLGAEHPDVALCLNNLAVLLKATNRRKEAEPLSRRHLQIFHRFGKKTGHQHPQMQGAINNYKELLKSLGKTRKQIGARLRALLK